MSYVKKSLDCLAGYRFRYIGSKIIYIILSVFGMLDYYFISVMITAILTGDVARFKKYLLIMVLFNGGLTLFTYLLDIFYAKLMVRINNSIRQNIYKSYFSFYQFSEEYNSSKMNNIFLSDYYTPMSYLDSIFSYITEFVILMYIVIVLTRHNVWFLYTLLLAIPIVCVNWYYSKKIREYKEKDYYYIDKILGIVEKTTSAVYNVFSFAPITRAMQKTLQENINEKIVVVDNLNKNKLNLQYSIELIMKTNIYTFYFLAAGLIAGGKLDPQSFVFISFYIQKTLQSIIALTKIIPQLQMHHISLDRLFYILDKQEKYLVSEEDKQRLSTIENIQIREGSFVARGVRILEDVNFQVDKATKILVQGENGSGKSSIMKLLTLQYQLENGELLINGMDVGTFRVDDVLKNINVLPQAPMIFPMSLRDNLMYDEKNGYPIEEIIEDFELQNCIEKLSNGLDTMVDENLKLSGGEKKKIDLVRCMTTQADLYVLDEPLANLDIGIRKKFDTLLHKYLKDKAVIVIEHGSFYSDFFNQYYRVKDGRLSHEKEFVDYR